MDNILYIKHLPKEKIIYHLWYNAITLSYLEKNRHKIPLLTNEIIIEDINNMYNDNKELLFTIYFGKPLYVELTGDYLNVRRYNKYNGKNKGQVIIKRLKKIELKNAILKYYKSF